MTAQLAAPLETTAYDLELEANAESSPRSHLKVVENTASANKSMHSGVFKLFVVINTAILGVFWLTFSGDAEALFMVTIGVVYLAAYLGIPLILNRVGRIDPPQQGSFHRFLDAPFETWTGFITGRAALIQVILIPSAILVAVIGMGLIIGANQ